MSITPLTSATILNPLAAAQQASAIDADDFAPESAAAPAVQGTSAANAGNLTGSSTGALSSQTLQALMNLTQADPQSQAGAQKAHRHHHGGGGGGGGSQSLSQLIQTQSMTGADPSIAELDASDAGDDRDSDSLTTALGL